MNSGIKLIGEGSSYQLQQLARHQSIVKLLADIQQDMIICKIEGWDEMEYLEQLRHELEILPHKVQVKHKTKGSERPAFDLLCSECNAKVSRFKNECLKCGSKLDGEMVKVSE